MSNKIHVKYGVASLKPLVKQPQLLAYLIAGI